MASVHCQVSGVRWKVSCVYLLNGPEQAAGVEWEFRVGRRVGPLDYNVEWELRDETRLLSSFDY